MNDTPTPESNKAKIAFTSLFANDDAYWIPYTVGIKLERERDAAQWCHEKCFEDRKRIIKELNTLQEQVKLTIMENLHLADGDNCTLGRLKDAIGFSLDSPENA
jgi:hypothetical protein